jgi:membrane-associated PAP2 superfamily phosphatase
MALAAALLTIVWGQNLDLWFARQWFFDPVGGWLGQGQGAWWARGLLHTGGRTAVRLIVLLALAAWLLSYIHDRWRHYRRTAGYVALSMVTASLLVGALKHVTNVDCPWDMSAFGGTRPYVEIFSARPPELPQGQCFPGAHSGSGFSLLCLYFAGLGLRDHRKWLGLAAGLLVGSAFAFGQEARGAHFLSHDLTSAAIAWLIAIGLYYWMLGRPATIPPVS